MGQEEEEGGRNGEDNMIEKLEECPTCGNKDKNSWYYDSQRCMSCGYPNDVLSQYYHQEKYMVKKTFVIGWKKDLGPAWMNENNLLRCLTTTDHCGEGLLLKVDEIKQ